MEPVKHIYIDGDFIDIGIAEDYSRVKEKLHNTKRL